MDNVAIYVCANFGDDRLWNEKALADRKSDNNNIEKKKKNNNNNRATTTTTFVALGDLFSSPMKYTNSVVFMAPQGLNTRRSHRFQLDANERKVYHTENKKV